MTYAYDKVYLEKAQAVLARMLDFAVYDMGYDLEVFMNLFLSSGVAKRFGHGDFTLIAGKSGVELTYEVLDKSNVFYERVLPNYTMNRSPEFWLGWVLAYYQWHTGMTFNEIIRNVSVKELLALYSPYHEMDILQFVDKVNDICREKNAGTSFVL